MAEMETEKAEMTKAEFVGYLQEKGFTVATDGSCVMIVTPDKRDVQVVDKLAKEAGYNGSRGWRKYGNVQTSD